MEERTLKRLLIMLAISIAIIMLFKAGITKTYTTLNKVAAEKKRASAVKPALPQQPSAASAVPGIIETPAVSAAAETTTADLPPASGVDEAQ